MIQWDCGTEKNNEINSKHRLNQLVFISGILTAMVSLKTDHWNHIGWYDRRL
jgi:hypothetical protein